MQFEPKLDKVVIKPEKHEEVTASGIIIGNTSMDRTDRGIVVAVGDGTDEEPMELSVGDKVIFLKNTGTNYEHNDELYIFMRQSDVLSILYN